MEAQRLHTDNMDAGLLHTDTMEAWILHTDTVEAGLLHRDTVEAGELYTDEEAGRRSTLVGGRLQAITSGAESSAARCLHTVRIFTRARGGALPLL